MTKLASEAQRNTQGRRMKITQQYLDDLTYQITGCAIEVHKQLGPGLLEGIYEKCFSRELTIRGISFIS
jgi:hypothetical protein